MKKISSLKIVLAVLGLSSVASLVGSISGTIAWYAYSSRALVSYTGTSVQSTAQLQVGIKSDVVVTFDQSVSELIQDVVYEDDAYYDNENVKHYHYHYYFMKIGSGGMPSTVINSYLSAKGYATNFLEPLSSYTYATGGSFNLRNRPATNKPEIVPTDAEMTKYERIPFVFRVFDSSGNAVGGHDIFLSGAEAVAKSSQDGIINESLRLYVDRNIGSGFILNPNTRNNGETKVAGVLDLSDDGYYDFDTFTNKEYLYGEYDIETNYTLDDCLSNGLPQSSGLVDINGSQPGKTQEQLMATTFASKHYQGIKYFETLENNHITPHTSAYLGTDSVFAKRNNSGVLESNYPLCTTDTSGHKLGTVDMVVYLEGWDFSVIDQEAGHAFYLGLTFEINLV